MDMVYSPDFTGPSSALYLKRVSKSQKNIC